MRTVTCVVLVALAVCLGGCAAGEAPSQDGESTMASLAPATTVAMSTLTTAPPPTTTALPATTILAPTMSTSASRGFTVEEEAYAEVSAALVDRLQESWVVVFALTNSSEVTSERLEQAYEALDGIIADNDTAKKMTPPPAMAGVHATFLEVFDDMARASSLLKRGLQAQDQSMQGQVDYLHQQAVDAMDKWRQDAEPWAPLYEDCLSLS